MGTPFLTGANHILSRGAHRDLALDIRNLDLLCVVCHTENANTDAVVRQQFEIMQARYGYDYSGPPYRYYLEAE